MNTAGALFFFLTLKTIFEGLIWHYWKQIDFKESLKFTAAQSILLVPYWFIMSFVVFTLLGLLLNAATFLSIPIVNLITATLFVFGLTMGNNIVVGLLTKIFFFKQHTHFTNRTIAIINGTTGLFFIFFIVLGRIIESTLIL